MNSQLYTADQKKLSVLLVNSTHKNLKLQALKEDKNITEIVTSLIETYILHPDIITQKNIE